MSGGIFNGHGRTYAMILGGATFVGALIDALNGFSGLSALSPFITKSAFAQVIESQQRSNVADAQEIKGKLNNLQAMLLDLMISNADGQINSQLGEATELTARLKDKEDSLLRQRLISVQSSIDDLKDRKARLQCFLDNLQGFNRQCR